MATFTKTFTLKDIFNNKKLQGKLPLINYKEKETETGKISVRTSPKTVRKQVFDTATTTAKAYYKPLLATRAENTLTISGTLTGDYDEAVESIYKALQGIRSLLIWTANNGDIIRDALKESEKNKRLYGIDSKLLLRVQSMAQIEGMSRPQLQALMADIMENIVYGDDFPQTQKKWGVQSMPTNSPFDYNERKRRWQIKVGKL